MLDILHQIEKDQQVAKEYSQKPATHAELETLADAMRFTFDAVLPEELEKFLKVKNGLDYNGLVIYGSSQSSENRGAGGFWQGLMAANILWRENGALNYIVIGETEMDIFTVSLSASSPTRRDRVSGDIIEHYPSVSAMLETAMKERF